MNENQMKMIVPPTVGFIVAGVASGIFYLLIENLRKWKSSKSVFYDDSRCACCLKPFLVGRGVECNDCGARSCRKACCRWDSIEESWFCLFCYHNRTWARRREKWFRSFGGLSSAIEKSKNFSTAKSQIYDEGVEHVAIDPELDLASGGRTDSMETVREFVEKIVEGLVGNVDDTPIDRLYDHPSYDELFDECAAILASSLTRLAMSLRLSIGNKPATDTPTMAHTALRELVERAVDEARKLPCLGATVSTTVHEDSTFSEQNYEDLLATAILNKVIEKFQNERVDGNSNVVHRRIRSKYRDQENEFGVDEGVEEGSSSLEPLSQDDCSSEGSGPRPRHARVRKEPMSLTIEEQIEEVTTTYGSDEDLRCSKANVLDFRNSRRVPFPEFGMDIVDPCQDSSDESQEDANDLGHVDLITPIESWEENWLFQKRKIQTQSEPVSMLVPNPSADYRALIGDKDAEDTSDLSEFSAGSGDELENDELLIEAINRSVPKSSKISSSLNDSIFEKVLDENEQMDDSSLGIVTTGLSIESLDDNDQSYVDKQFENVYLQNIQKSYQVDENLLFPQEMKDNRDSGLSDNSFEPVIKYLSEINPQIPKMPSFDLDTSKSINDQVFDEPSNVQENSTVERLDDESRDKDKDFLSCDVNENFQEATMSGYLEDAKQEMVEKVEPKVKQCEQRLIGSLSKENISSNENDEKVDEIEKMTNNESSNEETVIEEGSKEKLKVVAPLGMEILKNGSEPEIGLATPPRPGTIAEREHKKWENAPPIENNPYSEENIQKRLLERQYARRSSSDLSGSSSKMATSPSPPLQILLGANRPDFKRFGRDYYINEAKSPNGRNVESGFYTATSRPNSSMSQNSLSTGSDYEHQERSRSVETESTCSTSSESPRKFIRERRRQSNSDISSNSYDEIIESQRKNSKNVMNERLNNRGILTEDKAKTIKRIDLRAYGFENEFPSKNGDNHIYRSKSNRVINKLDLRSFGYDFGLRRTQSINNIDAQLTRESSPEILTKSSQHLNDDDDDDDVSHSFHHFVKISSAKSVPHIDQVSSRFHQDHGKSDNLAHENSDGNGKFENSKSHETAINGGKKSFLPSVKRLAQAFNKPEETKPIRRASKTAKNSSKDRATTPEIHIVDTPRQMHSLTARSISREFREGLRKISSKETPPSKCISEQSHNLVKPSGEAETQAESMGPMARGKLRSNIHFWEEMNKKP